MPERDDVITWPDSPRCDSVTVSRNPDTSSLEEKFREVGLTDVQTLDSTIRVYLRYATTDNYMHTNFYGNFNRCYLQPEIALMLVKAQQYLRSLHPEWSLLIWDAARPLSVQKVMWQKVKPPPGISRGCLVSNPDRGGSLHNYGCAVDVTIADENGDLLEMGSDFDCFDEVAWPIREQELLKNAKLTKDQVTNRKLLRSVMYRAGFWNIQTEWWHFNAMRRETAIARYKIIP